MEINMVQREQPLSKELAETIEVDSRNWRGIGIAILVIIFLCAIIATAVFFLSPELREMGKHTKKDKLLLEEIIQGIFSPRGFNGTWISDFELLYTDHEGNLLLLNLDVKPLKPRVFVKKSILQSYLQKYSLSPDRNYLLITYEMKKVFRHTYYARHKIIRINDEQTIPVTPDAAYSDLDLEYAAWGPSGSQLVFVYRRNIYYQPNATARPVPIAVTPSERTYYNGIPDWLYEEEILASSNAIWWSPRGSRICYASFNDSRVDIMQYQRYGSYDDPNNLYPVTEEVRYPKPGRPNPVVKLWIHDVDVAGVSAVELVPPPEIKDTDHYFTTVSWLDEARVAVTWLTRVQNYSVVSICSLDNEWVCKKSYELGSGLTGWVELYEPPLFSEDKRHYFLRVPSFQGKRDGFFRHIAKIPVEPTKGGAVEYLTSGTYDTTEILSFNPKIHTLYYISTLPDKAGQRHLFSVDVNTKRSRCFTCQSNDCLYNSASFSAKATYFALECWGPRIPWTELRTSNENELYAVLQTNDLIRDKLPAKLLPGVKVFSVPLDGGFNASVKLYIPPSVREDEVTKYPLLINVYGGPGSQQVNEKFSINWGTYLAVRKNIVYGYIDGRGSGFRGDKLLHTLYRHLGTVEVDDQVTVTRHIVETFPFIDKKRVGIWGWSYGGYVTAMALAAENSVFSCGIAVAPVSSWLYYDSAYTERYMGFPTSKDNYLNYRNADVFQRAINFKSKKFLLVHGTADDNVHLQQAMMLTRALARTGIMFQQQIYPDENHALLGVTRHLYQTMEAFLGDSFKLDAVYDDVGLKRRRVLSQG